MIERARDKIPAIRIESVHALTRLQNPRDPDDQVTAEFVRMVNSDANKYVAARCTPVSDHRAHCAFATHREVRKAVLLEFGPSRLTIPEILRRIKDVKEDVRRKAFEVIGKLDYRYLTISQRISVLEAGLTDRFDDNQLWGAI